MDRSTYNLLKYSTLENVLKRQLYSNSDYVQGIMLT